MVRITDENRKWWILAAMGGTLALIVLDETVVGVALPTIQKQLGMTQVGSHWIINAYFLIFTILAAAGGKMGDIFGYRRMFLGALTIFGVSSIACGFAQNGTWIIVARGFQGLGAAVVFPFSIAMVTAVFEPEQRGRAFGIQTAVGGTFISLGPLVGGFFTEVLSWRWIFWINLPLVLIIATVILLAWREPQKPETTNASGLQQIDFKGLGLMVLALCSFVVAAMVGPDYGWDNPFIITGFAVGLATTIVFVMVETRLKNPLIELKLFSIRTFSVMNAIVFMGEFGKMALIIFGALLLQKNFDMNPLIAGIALLPAVVPSLFSSLVAGSLSDRFDARKISLIGLLLNCSAMIWMAVTVTLDNYYYLIPAFIAWGCSLPFHFVSTRRAAVNSVPADKLGQSSGLTMTAQLLGGTVGMATCSALYASTGYFTSVYLVTAAVMGIVALVGFFKIRSEFA
ncbi:MFS transporter [Sneathiella marina]|uniref:MFS transporter n=1 Tax=Sneathiella marina TaxID=2950108 RepID=A0ABY4VYP0_9PROT|nr:MFS transporter [Sneathiella marina]USG60050.1 MFS transporter [Sneathiella marina]